MNKVVGIFGLLVFVCLLTTIVNPDFATPYNIYNTLRWTSLFGIISIGVAFVIITGGIDLSIGSMIGLIGCALPMCLHALEGQPPGRAVQWTFLTTGGALTLGGIGWGLYGYFSQSKWSWSTAAMTVVGIVCFGIGYLMPIPDIPQWLMIAIVVVWMIEIGVIIGLLHGFLITQVKLQPFVVTLCGLLFYRGIARWLTDDQTQGFGTGYKGLKSIATGRPLEMFMVMFGVGVALALWGLFQAMTTKARDQKISPWSLVAIGTLLAAATGTRFFQDVSGLDKNAASIAQQILWYVGVVGGGLGLAAMEAFALRRGRWQAAAAAGVGGLGLGIILVAAHFFNSDAYVQNQSAFIAGVIAGLFLLLGGLAWLFSIAGKGDTLGERSNAAMTAAFGVFWMLGTVAIDRVEVPAPFLILIGLAVIFGVVLNFTVYGRYLLAVGRNPEGALYSGINVDRVTVIAYVICTVLTCLSGVLFALDINSVQPSGHGNFYELYAIAAAVLGGCSLRGGEGSIVGVLIGAAVMRVLYNAINILGISTQLEFAIIGVVILTGAIFDMVFKRLAERRARAESLKE